VRLPQDITNLVAIAIRDVIWFKQNVRSFLEECDIPKSIMVEVSRMLRDTPTIKIVNHVFDQLAVKGEEGSTISKKILTKMYYWNDLHTIPPERKDKAVASLKALQEGYRRYKDQQLYQEEQEKKMQIQRVERVGMRGLDHAKHQTYRDNFDRIHGIVDRQERGNQFQDLMNEIFDYYCEDSKGPFQRTGEQIDGLFYFDKHWYFVEVRWRDEKANAADVSILRDRAKRAFGGDVKALFVAFNGFSQDCLESLVNQSEERVILMDGFDLRCVLDCQIAFDVLLHEKQLELVMNKRPFVTAREVLAKQAASS